MPGQIFPHAGVSKFDDDEMLFERAEDENLLEDADSFHSANNYLEEEKVQIEDIEEDKTMLMKPKKLERLQKISQPEDVFEFED